VQAVKERLGAKERPICRWIDVNRKLLHYVSKRNDEPLRLRLMALATEHRRYGLPRMVVLLRRDGVPDNHKRIGRICRAAGLQVRKRIRRKLALGRGLVESAALAPNDRWSLDFVHDRLRTTSGSEKVQHSFAYSHGPPLAGLIELHGILYGTTVYGGTCGVGTVFSVT
jgi:putative transposase